MGKEEAIESAARDAADKIYSQDWRKWEDPKVPTWFNPTSYLLERHKGSAVDEKSALIVGSKAVTFRNFRALVERAACGLDQLGLRPDQRVLFFGTDSLEYLAVWLGAVRAGIIPAVVSDLYKDRDFLYFLTDTGASAVFIDEEQLPKLFAIEKELPASLSTIIIRGAAPTTVRDIAGRSLVDAAQVISTPGVAPAPLRHANDICYMFYSGGTTGQAKGIIHLAHDFALVPERQGHFWEYRSDDVVLATSKKYFTHGLWPGVLIPLYWGATAVIQREPPLPETVLRAVAEHGVSKLITVPTVLKNILEHVRTNSVRPEFRSVQMVVSASEKIPPEMFEQFHEVFGIDIFDSIGSSEVTYEWIANRPQESKRGSLGKPVFGYEIRLVGPEGNDISQANSVGEAWVKSLTSCFFYWRKFEKSRETFIGPWTRTGDNLYFDEDGFFWFAGREADTFKVKGLWVSPVEIEATITKHPAVLEAAVVSYEGSDGLTKPRAFVVLRNGYSVSQHLVEDLKARIQHIGGYKVPEDFRFVPTLPRTTLMKIDRRTLRQTSITK